MTAFERKTFTVPVGSRAVEGCAHGWLDRRGHCVLCGEPSDAHGCDRLQLLTVPDGSPRG